MLEAAQTALSYLGAIVWGFFDQLAAFLFGFLPDADSSLIQTINGWSYILSGRSLDFNVYYFLDMPLLTVFLSIWTAVTVAGLVIMVVRFVLDVIHKVMDSIPIIG